MTYLADVGNMFRMNCCGCYLKRLHSRNIYKESISGCNLEHDERKVQHYVACGLEHLNSFFVWRLKREKRKREKKGKNQNSFMNIWDHFLLISQSMFLHCFLSCNAFKSEHTLNAIFGHWHLWLSYSFFWTEKGASPEIDKCEAKAKSDITICPSCILIASPSWIFGVVLIHWCDCFWYF